MPLDPSIILGIQQPQFQNPMDAMTKAMTMKHLAMQTQNDALQNQQAQQQFGDEQAMRNAMSNNTTVGPDGSASINKAGVMGDLGKSSNPGLAIKAQMNFAQQDLAIQKQHLETMQTKLATTGQLLGGVSDQASYDNAKKQIVAMNGDISQLPPQYDPAAVKHAQLWAMNSKDQIESQQKQQELSIKAQDLALQRQKFDTEKHTAAFTGALGALNSSRQTPPDVTQAKTDRYNAQKVKDLVQDSNGNLNVNMIPVVAGEVAKIAQGGAPQREELENITPKDAQMMIARAKQFVTSNPQASEQQAFVKVYNDYANTIQNNANKVIANHVNGVISSYSPRLNATDKQNLINSFANNGVYGNDGDSNQTAPVTGNTVPGGATNANYTKQAPPPAADLKISNYAKQYGLDYSHAQAILAKRGYKSNGQ